VRLVLDLITPANDSAPGSIPPPTSWNAA